MIEVEFNLEFSTSGTPRGWYLLYEDDEMQVACSLPAALRGYIALDPDLNDCRRVRRGFLASYFPSTALVSEPGFA